MSPAGALLAPMNDIPLSAAFDVLGSIMPTHITNTPTNLDNPDIKFMFDLLYE